MKRLLVFLVLVGLAVPCWGGSTDVLGSVDRGHDLVRWWADTLKVLFRGVTDPWDSDVDTTYSFNFYVPGSLVVLGAPASALFDSVWVFLPKKVSGGGMVLRLKGFYVTPKHPSVADWPEIYHIYADTIICKEKCREVTAEEVFKWLEDPDNESLWVPTYLDYIISKRRIR